ncbi:PREDICTED: protein STRICTOSIDINE SYNTHASE-LIKE 12-like [Nicotiana attenuata]|nr:PREDICTED: protein STRICTOSIDINE SYNTHASE-LIKE 12-like [Nicotiana attenuata]
MIGIFLVLIFSSSFAYSTQLPPLPFKKLQLPLQTVGPDSTAFDLKGNGPYTSVADGRVLKYQGPNIGFIDFATTSPLRTKEVCDGTNDPNLLITCGRPLGLGFYHKTGDLYITDINYGLLSVGPNGGLATQLVSGINGVPFAFADSLDIDQTGEVIYFVDSGSIFRTRDINLILQSGYRTGRFFKYNIRTKQVTLLLSELSGPAGVALSLDGSYVLITEIIASRIRRFWLKGPKANSAEIFANLTGHPDNIKRTILRIDVLGNVVVSLNITAQYPNSFSEVQEYFGRLYIGSFFLEYFVGVYGV